jgi:hypothetical protein
MNSRLSHLQQNATQAPWYIHGKITQGHTEEGQVLGAPGGYGGGGGTIALDRYSRGGRTTIRWDRLMQAEIRAPSGLPVANLADVIHAISFERTRMVHRVEVTTAITGMKEFNRPVGGDVNSVRLSTTLRLLQ